MFFLLCILVWKSESSFNEPIVSVVVPVYNMDRRLSRCIGSILNQTLQNIEIICIDDGSKDSTLGILKDWSQRDNRVIVIHQENCGVSCSRNVGISLAKGEYIIFVDSDDQLEPDFLEVAYNIAEKGLVDIVEGNVYTKNTVKSGPSEEAHLYGIDATRHLLPGNNSYYYDIHAKLYRTSIIKKNNITFEKSIKFGEDRIFNLDLAPFINSVCSIPKVFYNYAPLSTGLCGNRSWDWEGFITNLKIHLENMRNSTTCINCLLDDDFKGIELQIERYKKRIIMTDEGRGKRYSYQRRNKLRRR